MFEVHAHFSLLELPDFHGVQRAHFLPLLYLLDIFALLVDLAAGFWWCGFKLKGFDLQSLVVGVNYAFDCCKFTRLFLLSHFFCTNIDFFN